MDISPVWEAKLKDIQVDKELMDSLVANYLVTEGYHDAATVFMEESATSYHIAGDDAQPREEIRKQIQSGSIQEASDLLNEINPEIQDCDPRLNFSLKLQQFIEIFKAGDINTALSFAEQELAPRAEGNSEFISDLEQAMSLFAFDEESLKESPVGELLGDIQRMKTAAMANEAILKSFYHEKRLLPSLDLFLF